jgi:transcription elongation factor Elf1
MDEDKLRRTLEAKGAKPDCPSCGSGDWTTVPGALVVVNVNFLGDKAVNVAPIVCSNCGLMRLHLLEALESQGHYSIPRF